MQTITNHYYKDRPEGMNLLSGLPLPKSPDGKVHNINFVDCSFHPNCAYTEFVGCTFTGCDDPSK